MLGFDQQNTPNAANASPQSTIFDADINNFEERVIKASMNTPVLVDFWAPWCEPCKQLMPALESATTQAGGKILLAKVNLDENQQLGQMLRVQSVPTVFAFFQGQPIDAFTGVQTPAQIQEFIKKTIETARQAQPDALDIPETLKIAAQALSENNLQMAQAAYAQILQLDPLHLQAFIGMIRVFIAAGQLEQAEQLLAQAPPEMVSNPKFSEAKTALDMAQAGAGTDTQALRKKIAKNAKDHQARLDLSSALFAQGEKEDAIDQALESLRLDPKWKEEAARKQILKYFEAMGASDPLTMSSRRKLSSILFS